MLVIDEQGDTWYVFGTHKRTWGRTLDIVNVETQVEIREAPAEYYTEVGK